MIQTLTKNWWLLALCGVLYVPISVIYFIMYNAGPEDFPPAGWYNVIVLSSRFVLAAGVCSAAAGVVGIWKPKGTSPLLLLLVLNGLALCEFGGFGYFWTGPHSFNFFALLMMVMAMSVGILALAIARALRRNVPDQWFFGLAGAASVGVAVAFLALVSGWIQLESRAIHPLSFLWVCLYFGFAAIFMLGIGLRLHSQGISQSRQWEALPPLGNPTHA